jgi:AcrR family transcriptional regulator
MSRKMKAAPRPNIDRRVLQTRDALGDALVQLMHQKPFEEITVQQVLDRAEVGRSTFYAHYRDKDDLFLSDVDDFWEGMATLLARRGEKSNRVAPVRELFAHIAEAREFYAALVASAKIHDVLESGQGHFARGIDQRLAESKDGQAMAAGPRSAIAHAFAGALFSLLSWWIDRGMAATPEQMDDVYHHMVWSGIKAPAAQLPAIESRPKNRKRVGTQEPAKSLPPEKWTLAGKLHSSGE